MTWLIDPQVLVLSGDGLIAAGVVLVLVALLLNARAKRLLDSTTVLAQMTQGFARDLTAEGDRLVALHGGLASHAEVERKVSMITQQVRRQGEQLAALHGPELNDAVLQLRTRYMTVHDPEPLDEAQRAIEGGMRTLRVPTQPPPPPMPEERLGG
jgi:hypothetical protein